MRNEASPQAFFAPPAFRVLVAERQRLIAQLNANAACRLVTVTAPAGYGKTWLVSKRFATLRTAGSTVVWLGIGRADASEFLSMLVEGLARAGVDLGSIEAAAAQGFEDMPVAAAVRAVSSVLDASGVEVTVIVDDVHCAEATVTETVIAPLLVETPPSTRFVLSGRDIHGVPRADLRARGELCEIGIAELRFTQEEARELLPNLEECKLQRLLERTEGWPVALQLARMWLDAKPERSSLLSSFSGHTSEVAEYLTEQVISDLSPELQRTLSDVAILDALNSNLVAAVTDDSAAWRRILNDRRLEPFLVPLDEEHYWFRLHHLLLEYLRARRRQMSVESGNLHIRAAEWFQANGDISEAVRHCVLANDIARGAALIERTGGWEQVLFGGTSLLRRLLGAMPADKLTTFPRVQLYRAFLAAKDGQIVEGLRLYDEVSVRAPLPKDSALERDLMIAGHLISRYADRTVGPDGLSALYRQYQSLHSTDTVGRAALMNSACLMALAIGQMPQALEACINAIQAMRRTGSVIGLSYCLCHLGLVQLHLGERREAEATLRESAALAEENFGADSGLKAITNVYLALTLHARGEIVDTDSRLTESLEQVEAADGWLDLYAEAYEVAVDNAFALGRAAKTAELLERMRKTAARRGLNRLDRLCTALRMQNAVLRRFSETKRGSAVTAATDAPPDESPEKWRPGEWRQNPSQWREWHATGVAHVLGALSKGQPQRALPILDDLSDAAMENVRRRHLRLLSALRATALLQLGDADGAMAIFEEPLQAAVSEDDTQFLVDYGAALWPLLETALARSRALAAGSRVRHVLTASMASIRRARVTDTNAELSARELEVLLELVHGAPNKIIARNLQMTENTVKFHLKSIFQKLNVRHRAGALYAARARGLIS